MNSQQRGWLRYSAAAKGCTQRGHHCPVWSISKQRKAEPMNWWNNLRLKSKDPQARRKAVEELTTSGDPQAVELLIESLNDEDAQVRRAAAQALGNTQDERPVDSLIATLRDPNERVREAAASALGQLGDPRATSPLLWALEDPSTSVRTCAAAGLRNLGWKPATREEEALFDIAIGNTRAAARAGEAAVASLVAELKHDTSFQRRAAAEALEEIDDPRRVQPLVLAARDPDPNVRVSAIYALAKETGEQVKTMLLNSLRDANPQVRLAATEVLAKQEDVTCIPCFFELLADHHFEVRLTAVQFLSKIRGPHLAEALVPLLQDPDNSVRRATAQALGGIGDPSTIEALVLALIDEEIAVRQAAGKALDQIAFHWSYSEAAQRAAAQLESSLSDRRAWVHSAARQALVKLRASIGGARAAG